MVFSFIYIKFIQIVSRWGKSEESITIKSGGQAVDDLGASRLLKAQVVRLPYIPPGP